MMCCVCVHATHHQDENSVGREFGSDKGRQSESGLVDFWRVVAKLGLLLGRERSNWTFAGISALAADPESDCSRGISRN